MHVCVLLSCSHALALIVCASPQLTAVLVVNQNAAQLTGSSEAENSSSIRRNTGGGQAIALFVSASAAAAVGASTTAVRPASSVPVIRE